MIIAALAVPFFGADGRAGTTNTGLVVLIAVGGLLLGGGVDGLGNGVAEGGLEGGGDTGGCAVARSCEAGIAGLEARVGGE